ncbi:hypothetical protein ACFQMH_26685 [Streptomyces viridiviolaceus]|uniref:Integral-membrane protein n=1 Tax=Streptomyces viridiviolaceus TaxID=68282 RepID=A0ABW2E952_9ACTN|nr:hypothetical protein [Streptomyces viridiviolaceus]
MTAGWCARTVGAAVFAAVCVLLASLGHVMMSGIAVPWWALTAGAVAVGGSAWWPAGRERGPLLVVSCAVVAQAVLHSSFALAQAVVRPRPPGESLVRQWLDLLLCATPPGRPSGEADAVSVSAGPMEHGAHGMHVMGTTAQSASADAMTHGMAGMSSTGMLAAHLLAAVLSGLWLAHGERAAFRVLRALAARLVAPLRLLLPLPAPAHRPRVRARRRGSDRAPHRFLLTHAITSRGPPPGSAVA